MYVWSINAGKRKQQKFYIPSFGENKLLTSLAYPEVHALNKGG